MLTRIEVEYMTVVPRELKKLNENLEKLIESINNISSLTNQKTKKL